MIELPKAMRQLTIDHIDENFAEVGMEGSAEEYAAAVVEAIETAADEVDGTGDEVVSHMEASAELDDSLEQTLAEGFEEDPEFDYIGEKVLAVLERMCKIEWRDDRGGDMFLGEEDF